MSVIGKLKRVDIMLGDSLDSLGAVKQTFLLGVLRIIIIVSAYCLLAYPAGYLDLNYIHSVQNIFNLISDSSFQIGLVALPLFTLMILLPLTLILLLVLGICAAGGLFED